jgi:hypothetical protein
MTGRFRVPSRLAVALSGVVTLALGGTTLAGSAPAETSPLDAPRAVGVPRAVSASPQTVSRLPVEAGTAVAAAVLSVSPFSSTGLVVYDLEAEAEILTAEPDARFQSASLVKLLIAIASPAADPSLMTRMLRASDDPAASLLWGLAGGDQLPTAVSRALGIPDIPPPDDQGQWGNTLMSARDTVAAYRYLLAGFPSLVDQLRDAPQRAADGYDQYFGIPSAFPGPWAIKQGWGTSDTATTAHTTGLLLDDRYLVVLMTSHPPGTSLRSATNSATAGATALAAYLKA